MDGDLEARRGGERTVDVVVIGAGAVGENVAGRAARGGLDVVLVEAALVGGECSYWACMPSKALLRPGDVLAAARDVPGAKQSVAGPPDADRVLAWRDRITSGWDDASQAEWVAGAGVALVRGRAVVAGERLVEVTPLERGVGAVRLRARHAVVVATGSVPSIPPVDGLDRVPYWTSKEATSAHDVPPHLLVLGGGVVGSELAQAYLTLGSTVDLVSTGELLGTHEPFAGAMVRESLEAQGARVHSGAEVSAARAPSSGAGTVELVLADGSTLAGDRLLVATGRTPATRDLGLEAFGVVAGDPLEVDDSGRVEAVGGGWLYAAGDVTGRAPLTHQGKYGARVVGDVIAARTRGTVGDGVEPWSPYAMTADHDCVPQVVFTRPQVASVGLTVRQARERLDRVREVDIPIAVGGSALHAEHYEGRAVLVVDERRQVVVGATFVGPDVAELLHSATVAVVGQVPLHRLWHAVPSYPTVSEVWLRLLEAYGL